MEIISEVADIKQNKNKSDFTTYTIIFFFLYGLNVLYRSSGVAFVNGTLLRRNGVSNVTFP